MIIEIGLKELSIGVISIGFIQWLFSLWVKLRLEKSIKHEYDKKIEEYRFLQIQREKAEISARLFAKWIKYRGQEEKILNRNNLIDYYEELNRMSLELSLWIPDGEKLNEIMSRFGADKNAKDTRTLVGELRKLILNKEADNFDSQNIILWPKDEISKRLFYPDNNTPTETHQ